MIIAIANQKGGVAKTTMAINLGHGLALRSKRVLSVDTDPQGQVATFLGLRQEPCLFDLLVGGRPLADVVRSADANGNERPGLRVIPSGGRLLVIVAIVLLVLSAVLSLVLSLGLSSEAYRNPVEGLSKGLSKWW